MRIAVSLKYARMLATNATAVRFQSAVRIAVSLKGNRLLPQRRILAVSIRRADRCLAEVPSPFAPVCSFLMFQSAVRIAVSLKRAPPRRCGTWKRFQSAVRIAVSLKYHRRMRDRANLIRLNPPCGSLSR